MKEKLITLLLEFLLKKIDAKLVKVGIDAMLDAIEDYVEKTPNKYDDAFIGGLCKTLRVALDVPDNDEVK